LLHLLSAPVAWLEGSAWPRQPGCSPRIECRRAIHQGERGPVGPPGLVALRLAIAVDRVSTDSMLFPSKVIAVGVARGACVMEVAKRRLLLRRRRPHRQEEAREERGRAVGWCIDDRVLESIGRTARGADREEGALCWCCCWCCCCCCWSETNVSCRRID
jgi:hypothetical protein